MSTVQIVAWQFKIVCVYEGKVAINRNWKIQILREHIIDWNYRWCTSAKCITVKVHRRTVQKSEIHADSDKRTQGFPFPRIDLILFYEISKCNLVRCLFRDLAPLLSLFFQLFHQHHWIDIEANCKSIISSLKSHTVD